MAARHVWIQHLPPGAVPVLRRAAELSCCKVFPLGDVIRKVLTGTGECHAGSTGASWACRCPPGCCRRRGWARLALCANLRRGGADSRAAASSGAYRSLRSACRYIACSASMSATRTHSFTLWMRGVEHAELDDLGAHAAR